MPDAPSIPMFYEKDAQLPAMSFWIEMTKQPFSFV